MKIYNSKIKDIRLAKRFTMTALADKIGVSRQTYFNWESGRNKASEENVRKLSNVFDVSVDEISDLPPELPQGDNLLKDELPNFMTIINSTLKERFALRDSIIKQVTMQSSNLEVILAILKNFLDTFDAILYSKDTAGNYLLANNSFKANLNIGEQFVATGKSDFDFYPSRIARKIHDEDIEVIKTGIAVKYEGYIYGYGKKKRWGLISKEPAFDTNTKKILGMICCITDITEQKKRENALLAVLKSCLKAGGEACLCVFRNDDQLFIDRKLAINVLGVPSSIPNELFMEYCLENIIFDEFKDVFLKPEPNDEIYYQIKHPIKGAVIIKEKFIQLHDMQIFILENADS